MGLRDKVLSLKSRLRRERVELPELADVLGDEELYVREMTGRERDDFEQSRVKLHFDSRGRGQAESNFANLRARLVAKCLTGADGKRLFDDEEADQVGELPGSILDKLYETAQRLSGLSKEAEVELEKNLRKVAGTDSSTGSPGTSAGAASNGALATSAAES